MDKESSDENINAPSKPKKGVTKYANDDKAPLIKGTGAAMMASASQTKYQNLNPEDVMSGPNMVVPVAVAGTASEGTATDDSSGGGGGTFVVG